MATTAIAGGRVDSDGVFHENDIESNAGVESVDELLAKRFTIVEELAPLWAEYGPGGLGESRLSAERARLVEYLRSMAAKDERKVTESGLETASRAHKDYLDKMAEITTERAKFFKLQEQMRAIDFKINRGQSLLRAYASEVRT